MCNCHLPILLYTCSRDTALLVGLWIAWNCNFLLIVFDIMLVTNTSCHFTEHSSMVKSLQNGLTDFNYFLLGLINSLTKSLTFFHVWFIVLFDILYTLYNVQKADICVSRLPTHKMYLRTPAHNLLLAALALNLCLVFLRFTVKVCYS